MDTRVGVFASVAVVRMVDVGTVGENEVAACRARISAVSRISGGGAGNPEGRARDEGLGEGKADEDDSVSSFTSAAGGGGTGGGT
jgi:hypothetical protein